MKNGNLNLGRFEDGFGCYTLTKIPEAGLYEYIYKNNEILLKLDQYGVQTCQIDPPSGIALVKRERREIGSPIKTYFSVGKKVFNNFDIYKAKKFSIGYTPQKAVYTLNFVETEVVTRLFVPIKGRNVIVKTTVRNLTDKMQRVKIMPVVYPYANELMMAPWDKPEWYTRTEFKNVKNPVFSTERYSVQGKKQDRRKFFMVTDLPVSSFELSDERLIYATDNFSVIPDKIGGKTQDELYAFGQCFAGLNEIAINPHEEFSFTKVFAVALYGENQEKIADCAKAYLYGTEQEKAAELLDEKFNGLFAENTVKTKDEDFNKFVNGFLPLELDWVCALDRGWPTGMRGVRDASTDFEGYLCYSAKKCREVIERIFLGQRSDGWYPRQIPFGGDKYDLRNFIDGVCFFTEFVYEYLAATDDFGVLDEEFGYYDAPDVKESGFEHLKKGVEYLTEKENVGDHGLVKLWGGDWLDCLRGAGEKGRGESVMVSCQLVLCFQYVAEICEKRGENADRYRKYAEKLDKTVNAVAFNDKGFYNAVFTDCGEWIFSDADPDGECRVYVPTNSFAIIGGIAKGKEKRVISNVETLKTEKGYKLFSVPFGKKQIDGIGKMGTGDFLPYFMENASVYNHGSQLFYARALAEAGEYKKLYDVLNFAMPFNGNKHVEKEVCAAPYAITNCYLLVPSFYGRAGFSFLTGSVAMIERAVYSWVFGVRFTLDELQIKPCIPKEYANAFVKTRYKDKTVEIKYDGFGNKVKSATLNGKPLKTNGGKISIKKEELSDMKNLDLHIEMNNRCR